MTSKQMITANHILDFKPRIPAMAVCTTAEMQATVARNPALGELIGMHRYMRPAGSKTENAFRDKYLLSMPGVSEDGFGNLYAAVGENPVVLWSSHTDTVHRNEGMQKVAIQAQFLRLSSKALSSTCLGADCTVGVWLMRQMYLARVPGLYIWHVEEEIGGGGSQYIAQHQRDMLTGIQAAIAFDRKGTSSVITHQFSSRTASDTFAKSLGDYLGGYAPDKYGTFTDTANYEHIVPECTNISVGYYNAHTSDEATDLLHATALLDKMLKFDASTLKIARDPTAETYDDQWERYMRGNSTYGRGYSVGWESALDDDFRDAKITLYDVVSTHPRAVADMLDRYAISAEELMSDAGILSSDVRRRRR